MPALELKGKSEPVDAWRLLDVEPEAAGVARRMDSPLVGRGAELDALLAELERVVADRACRIVTIVGEPGVGKSRLAAELIASAGEGALALEGRCLPYGNGITYWPLVEVVRDLDLERVLGGEPDGVTAHERILEAVGRAEPRSRSDELYWAIRHLLETLARERPLVLVLDDIQWAEPAFLDLVEYLAGWSRDAPILVCCLARPDLAEVRPAWAGTTIQLSPLPREHARSLLENLAGPLDPEAADAVGRATGGNPLFLEEMLRMLVEDGVLVERDGRLEPLAAVDSLRVPETVQAVLAARLDRLDEDELSVLQRAAVIGQVFWWGAVADLSPPEEVGEVAGRLQALVRKGLIKPDVRTFAGEDGFRFGHILIRDAAYDSISKQLRAELHERFAAWAEQREGAELDEIIGHHLEQARSFRLELGPAGPVEAALAERAADRLTRAGRRALIRGDASAASGLLGRAAALEPTPELLLDLADAQMQLGLAGEAEWTFERAVDGALAAGDQRSTVRARLGLARIGFLSRGELQMDELAAEVARALPAFEAAGDDATVARLLAQLAEAYWWRCQIVRMQDALERALAHARRAGDERLEANVAVQFGFAAIIGPLPVEDGRRSIARTVEHMSEDTSAKGMLLLIAAFLAAMAGDFDGGAPPGGGGDGDARLARPQRRPRRDQHLDERDRPARGRRCGGGAGAPRRARAARAGGAGREPRFGRGTAGRDAGRGGPLRGSGALRCDERAQRCSGGHPRADRLAGRPREGLCRPRGGSPRGDGRPRGGRPGDGDGLAVLRGGGIGGARGIAGRIRPRERGRRCRGRRARALRGEGERRRRRAAQSRSRGGTYSVDAGVTAAARSASGVGRISGAIPTKDDAS